MTEFINCDWDVKKGITSNKCSFLDLLSEFSVIKVEFNSEFEFTINFFNSFDVYHSPIFESKFVTDFEVCYVFSLDKDRISEDSGLFSKIWVIEMVFHSLSFWSFWPIQNGNFNRRIGKDSEISLTVFVNNLLIKSPEFIPFHSGCFDTSSDIKHELFKSLDCESSPHETLNCRESRIIPPFNLSFIDEPLKFSLTHKSRLELELGILKDFNLFESKFLLDQVVERISFSVFYCSKTIGNSFKSVNNWTSKIISWISLILCLGLVMRSSVASVHDWVS
mmetsp:Transcript_18480/g.18169  ORF Transcript_18480/g.18169 Transcript_18480/m.18169 type:complete len:278 (+) Transcript_18480:466-1299(+)